MCIVCRQNLLRNDWFALFKFFLSLHDDGDGFLHADMCCWSHGLALVACFIANPNSCTCKGYIFEKVVSVVCQD
jgi:hypothetical protein